MILDTTFLIDLQREYRRSVNGPTREFLQEHRQVQFKISVISATEFLEGFDPVEIGIIFLRPLEWIPVDARIAQKAASYRRELRRRGESVGDFDLLIGATAKVLDLPLVTRNSSHFHRLEGLQVRSY